MKTFEIVKGQTKIYLEVEKYVNEYGKLSIKVKIGNEEFWADDFDENRKIIWFWEKKEIEGKKVNGIKIDDEDVAKELAKIKEEAKKQRKEKIQEAFEKNLRLSYYYGDWYRVNAFFINFEYGGEAQTEVADSKVIAYIDDKYGIYISKPQKEIEKFFNFEDIYSKEEIQKLKKEFQEKYGLELEEKKIDDLRGKGYYISGVKGKLEDWDKVFDRVFLPIAAEKRKKEEEYKKRVEEALKKAKETGKEVIIGKIFCYDGDDWDEVKRFGTDEIKKNFPSEYGLIVVYEVATPDGKIVEKHVPSY